MCCCCHRHLISVAAIVPTSSCDSSNIRECMSWQVLGLILSIVIGRHHQKTREKKAEKSEIPNMFFSSSLRCRIKNFVAYKQSRLSSDNIYPNYFNFNLCMCDTETFFSPLDDEKKSRNENVMSPSVLESVSKDPFSLNVRWKLFQFTETWRQRHKKGARVLFFW